MFDPKLASFVGLHVGDVVVSLLVVFFMVFKREKAQILGALLAIFLAISSMTNYYQRIYLAGLLLISSCLLAAYFGSKEESEVLLILASTFVASSIVYYLVPLGLIGQYVEPFTPDDRAFAVAGGIIMFALMLSGAAKAYETKSVRRFLLGFSLTVYIGAVVGIAYVFGLGSHLIYGLAIMIAGVVLAIRGSWEGRVVYISGLLLVADNVVGFLTHLGHSPFSESFVVFSGLLALASLILIVLKTTRKTLF